MLFEGLMIASAVASVVGGAVNGVAQQNAAQRKADQAKRLAGRRQEFHEYNAQMYEQGLVDLEYETQIYETRLGQARNKLQGEQAVAFAANNVSMSSDVVAATAQDTDTGYLNDLRQLRYMASRKARNLKQNALMARMRGGLEIEAAGVDAENYLQAGDDAFTASLLSGVGGGVGSVSAIFRPKNGGG